MQRIVEWISRRHVATGVALVALAYLMNLAFVQTEGRLSAIPLYDDVVYLNDSMQRLMFAQGDGVLGIVRSFLSQPPHSPVSTATGLVGFSLFGPHLIAAYAANLWILLTLVWVVISATASLQPWSRVLVLGLVLYLPATHAMITEFRPDLAAGLLFGIALHAVMTTPLLGSSLARRVGVGAIAAAAMVAKPSGFVVMLPMYVLTFIATLIIQAVVARAWLPVLKAALPGLAAFMVPFSVFAAIWGPSMVPYAYQALVSNNDIWRTNPDPLFNWLYHSFGSGGRLDRFTFR